MRSPLIGRERELAVLRAVLEKAVAYQAPQFVTILGNQGTGKSRLVEEWTKAIGAPVRVFRGRAAPDVRYSAIDRLLRDRLGLGEEEDTEEARGKFRDTVGSVFGDRRVGEMLHFLGGFVGFRYADSPFLRAFQENPVLYDEVARALLRRFFEVDSAASPLVLVLDDLHGADDETLELLEELGAGLAGSSVVLVACARPELLVRRPRWGAGADDATRIELRNLEANQAVQLFRGLLARVDKVPDDLALDAVEATGGNPFLLSEMVRLFLENGSVDSSGPVWKLDAGRAAETELPISVEEAISARIAVLDKAERDLLEKGAVFGNVFWKSAVVTLTRLEKVHAEKGRPPPPPPRSWTDDELANAIQKRVDSLCERDYLLCLPPEDSTIPGDVEIVFKHNLERDLVARMVDGERKRRYHRGAAQWLESKLSEPSEEQLEFLAQLYERGDDARRAARCFLAAGDRARERYANGEAVGYYRHALSALELDDVIARMDALHNLGTVLVLVGKSDEAAAQFQEMLRTAWLFDHPAKAGAAHGRLGRIHRQRGDYERAQEHFQMAHGLFERASDRRGVAGALDDMGSVLWHRGNYGSALEHHKKALEIRRSLGDKRSIALSLANLGRVYSDAGAFEAAMGPLREALEIRREIADRPGMVSSMSDLGLLYEADGKLDLALDILGEALKLAKNVGDRLGQARCLKLIGGVELGLGRTPAAAEHVGQAVEIEKELGDKLGQAECARRMAEVWLVKGDLPQAFAEARKAEELATKLGSKVHVAVAQRVLAEVAAAGGPRPEPDGPEELFRAAISSLSALHNQLELARCYRSFAAFREREGHPAEAVQLRMRADEIFARLRGASAARSQA